MDLGKYVGITMKHANAMVGALYLAAHNKSMILDCASEKTLPKGTLARQVRVGQLVQVPKKSSTRALVTAPEGMGAENPTSCQFWAEDHSGVVFILRHSISYTGGQVGFGFRKYPQVKEYSVDMRAFGRLVSVH